MNQQTIDFILKTTDNVNLNVQNFNHLVNDFNENVLKHLNEEKHGLYGVAISCTKCPDGIKKPDRNQSKLLI